jgi:MarR family transcriptional regulator, lower aerobic nicotinate degradation pathway regulator
VDVRTAPARLRSLPSWLLNQVALPAQRIVAEALGSVGARRQHYSVLSALEEFGPASQAALGRRCGIDRSDVVALVNELSAAGRLERTPDPEDRRRNVIAITDAGREFLETLDRLLAEAQEELLAPLPRPQRAELVRLLEAILAHHSG